VLLPETGAPIAGGSAAGARAARARSVPALRRPSSQVGGMMRSRSRLGFTLVEPFVRARGRPFDGLRTHQGERAAFTLIELLIVIAIIALLLTILAPTLRQAKEIAAHAVCGSQLHQIGVATLVYAAQAEGALPRAVPRNSLKHRGANKPFETHVAYWHDKGSDKWLFPDGSPMPWSLGLLWHQQVVGNPRLFYCLKQTRQTAGSRSYEYYEDVGWLPYGSTIDRSVGYYIHTGYLYIPYSGMTGIYDSRGDRPASLDQVRPEMVLAVDDIMGALTEVHAELNGQAPLGAPSPHPGYNWNVARFDGSVQRVAADETWVDDIPWPRRGDPWLVHDWLSFNTLLDRLERGAK
jgi:prepilin-type N-terminal cleavage/methylation domain-containing protein